MYGLTRATSTLICAAIAGALLWLATQVADESLGAYWAFIGLIAAAGLVMAASQLLGGWTKWGMPTISAPVLLLGFLPVLIAGGLVLLAGQPTDGGYGMTWADDIGLGWLAEDLAAVIPAIAFAIGLTFGYSFDTVPARDVDVAHERDDVHPAVDAPTTAERRHVATGEPRTVTVGPAHDDELVGAGSAPAGTTTTPGTDSRARRGLFRR